MIYFYVFYFVTVTVVINVVTAFLIDDFDVMRSQFRASYKGKLPTWQRRVKDAIAGVRTRGIHKDELVIKRKAHGIHLYETMFADEIHAHLSADFGDEEARAARLRKVAELAAEKSIADWDRVAQEARDEASSDEGDGGDAAAALLGSVRSRRASAAASGV